MGAIEILRKSLTLSLWIMAGFIIIPSTLIAYLFWSKWVDYFNNF